MIKKSPIAQLFELISVAQLANALDVSAQAVYAYIKRDHFPVSDILGRTNHAETAASLYNDAVDAYNAVRTKKHHLNYIKASDLLDYSRLVYNNK